MGLKQTILLNCKSATELLERRRDKDLSLAERFGLWLHLGYCKICTLFAGQSQIIDDVTKAYAQRINEEQKSYKLNERRKDEINRGLQQELEKMK